MDRWSELEATLRARYDACPSSILLAVLTSVAEVNRAATPKPLDPMAAIPIDRVGDVVADSGRVWFVMPLNRSGVSWTPGIKAAQLLASRGEAYASEAAALAEAKRRWEQ